jgi:hypothetical protein
MWAFMDMRKKEEVGSGDYHHHSIYAEGKKNYG